MGQGRRHGLIAAALALASAALAFTLLGQAAAQTARRCFAETGFCVEGPFRTFWERGGLAIFGFPLGPQGRPAGEAGDPGAPAEIQWFERHRFELHPANPAPYTILLGRLGAERLAQLGRDWRAAPPSAPQPGCRFFSETGRNLCPPFLAAWQAGGLELDGRPGVSEAESLALFGLPLTEAQEEEIEGRRYLVQWFERARFELHQDGTTARVLFGRLGAELLAAGAGGDTLPVATLEPTGTGVAGGQIGATATSAPRTPTATRPPRRPTATPDDGQAPPPVEPSSTSAPPPTSTRVPPTSTPRPTNTAQPTATPRPDPFKGPPASPPPGFGEDLGGLPSQGAGSQGTVEEMDAATTTHTIGAAFCLRTGAIPDDAAEVTYTVTGPDGDTARMEEVTIFSETDDLEGQWRWAPGTDYSEGAYIVTASVTDIAGSVIYSATGSITLIDPLAGSGRRVTTVRLGGRISDQDVNFCNDGSFGSPGDRFAVYLSGFSPGELVELHVYSRTAYLGLLRSLVVDDQGQGRVLIETDDDYQAVDYIIITQDQALEEARNPGYLNNEVRGWEQRMNLSP